MIKCKQCRWLAHPWPKDPPICCNPDSAYYLSAAEDGCEEGESE